MESRWTFASVVMHRERDLKTEAMLVQGYFNEKKFLASRRLLLEFAGDHIDQNATFVLIFSVRQRSVNLCRIIDAVAGASVMTI